MALVKCPGCGREISDKAKECPGCQYKLKNKKKKYIAAAAAVAVLVLIITGTLFGVKKVQQIRENERQEQIQRILAESEEYYTIPDFENVLKCYGQLEESGYDTAGLKELAEYDQKVYGDARTFYETLKEVDDKLHSSDYTSLRKLVDTLIEPMKKFDALEINTDSQLGQYINTMRSHIMYSSLQSEYVNSTNYDLDYGLTSWGFAFCIETYTEQLVKENFPYNTEG